MATYNHGLFGDGLADRRREILDQVAVQRGCFIRFTIEINYAYGNLVIQWLATQTAAAYQLMAEYMESWAD